MDQLKRKLSLTQSFKQRNYEMVIINQSLISKIYRMKSFTKYSIISNQAFGNLNHRFQQFLQSPSLLLKLRINSQSNELYMHIYKRTIHFNQHQILSINLLTVNRDIGILTTSSINSSFTRLKSLTLNGIESDILLLLLSHLASLPRLFSLLIFQWIKLDELSDCYALILNLPKLKYLKFFVNGNQPSNVIVSLPIPAYQPVSRIEFLVIDHPCTSQDLSNIIHIYLVCM